MPITNFHYYMDHHMVYVKEQQLFNLFILIHKNLMPNYQKNLVNNLINQY